MKILMALGGNALLQRHQPPEAATQQQNVKNACVSIATIAREHQIIITHGNGPQIGLLALQAMSYKDISAYPLDILGAESEGMIGYMLEQELRNLLPEIDIATLLTQVEVKQDDPAFKNPEKFIGPLYREDEGKRLVSQYQWQMKQEGEYFRRVVPSPLPQHILEYPTIEYLVNAGVLVICTGGGGIPVIRKEQHYYGVEAVIDKDLASALLATQLKVDRLLLLTDVSAVMKNWGTPQATPIGLINVNEINKIQFAEGSMAPKVKAACDFVEKTGGLAHIGSLNDAALLLSNRSGTTITSKSY